MGYMLHNSQASLLLSYLKGGENILYISHEDTIRRLARKKRIAEMKLEERKLKAEIWKSKHYILYSLFAKIKELFSVRVDTFTKRWISRLLWFGCIWISLSYVLAFQGKYSIAETLSQTVCTTIIATTIGYLIKAFFETFFEKKNEIHISDIQEKINSYNEKIVSVNESTENSVDVVG